ncbi:hypothetical protein [Pulveribacter sp.]|uniref:hypothetical protein n=1 Tax=Pulveribacter sp. TaxID=2678893 RepID=UPI0028A8EDBC|nr:hypothetical protein [Pulveribacter sp.]
MTAPLYITQAPEALRAWRQRQVSDREAADLLDWLASQQPDFISLAGGRGIDVGNTPGGLLAALRAARREAPEPVALPPAAAALGAGLDSQSLEQGEPI